MIFLKEFIEEVLRYYIEGMTEEEISDIVGISSKEVNKILDKYTKYL